MRLRSFLAAIAALLLLAVPASAHTREEVRASYQAINDWTEGGLFAEEPSVSAPYTAGEVRQEALADALAYLNFLRELAGLAPVALDAALTNIAQHGAGQILRLTLGGKDNSIFVNEVEVENCELLRDLLAAFASEETMRVLVHYFDKE